MLLGSIINTLSVALGGIVGTIVSNKMNSDFRDNLNMVLGIGAMTMGITSILHIANLPAVILSAILGVCIGMAIHLGKQIEKGGTLMQKCVCKVFPPNDKGMTPEQKNILVTAVTLFCTSGTGIYGAIVAGMTGDQSILITKSVLDFVTAMIFACSIGAVTSLIAVPQFCVYLLLILFAQLIYPLCSIEMVNDFKAVGGVLLIATGFRMLKLKNFPIADMIPAMLVAMPISYLWTAWIVPFLT